MPETKSFIIERLFDERWNAASGTLGDALVTLADVSDAIAVYNSEHPQQLPMSTRNPANFFKDFVRNKERANRNWPRNVLARGYTARQETGNNACFRFVPLDQGQTEPFLSSQVLAPTPSTRRHQVESASLPLASRRLGRADEPWLTQVVVRLRIIETHLALVSQRNIVQVDHLQMSVKLRNSEIDALFLAVEQRGTALEELIVCCEAKGRRDDILEDQVLAQVRAVFALHGITHDIVIPMAVKAHTLSEIYVVEFDAVQRQGAQALTALTVASDALYQLVPPVPGIGR